MAEFREAVRRDGRDPDVLIAAVIVVAVTGAFFLAPLTLLLLACVLAVAMSERKLAFAFLVASCALFTLLNISKALEGDLVNYINLQQYIGGMPFDVLFDDDVLASITGSYRVTEIGFYAPLWLLAQIFDNDRVAVAVGATLGIYVPTFFAFRRIGARDGWSIGLTMVVVCFAFFAAVNFVQTTHLLRQYVSTSFIFLAFSLYLSGRSWLALAVALFGCTIHNATLFLVADVAILSVLFPHRPGARRSFGSLVLRLMCALAVLVGSLAAGSVLELQQLVQSDSPISQWHYVVIGCFFAVFLIFSARAPEQASYVHYAKVAFVVVFTSSLGFFIAGLSVFAVRYFAYLEWLFPLMLGGMLHAMPRRGLGHYFFIKWFVIIVSTMILLARIQGAPWSYGGGHAEIFAASFIDLGGLLND